MNSTISRFSITSQDLQMSQFIESEHPRGQPGNAGEFAKSSDSKPNTEAILIKGMTKEESINRVNSRMKSAANAIGGDEWDVYEKLMESGVSMNDYPGCVRFLRDLAYEYENLPKKWESEDEWDMKNFDDSIYDTPEKAAEWKKRIENYNKVKRRFAYSLSQSIDVPVHKKKDYLESIQKVLKQIPSKSLEDIHRNAESVFYGSLDSLRKGVFATAGDRTEPKGTVGGCWMQSTGSGATGTLHLNGGYDDETRGGSREGIYAHELAHVLDFDYSTNKRISKSNEWQQAWGDEILDTNNLSEYAKSASHEGFAEFGRLVYTGRTSEAKSMFPKCFAVFKKHGLVK